MTHFERVPESASRIDIEPRSSFDAPVVESSARRGFLAGARQ
jgi:hypothetical protein